VIALTPSGGPTTDLEEWCDSEEINLINHRIREAPKGEAPSIPDRIVASVISILIDPTQHPVYVFCIDGIHATGIIVMCFRKVAFNNIRLTEHFF
jgi:tyrosine-protein phosphatase OCA6